MGDVGLESGRLKIRTGKLSFIWLCIEPSTAGIRGAIMGLKSSHLLQDDYEEEYLYLNRMGL